MEPRVRDARPDDRNAIAAFTTDTFAWGDYIGDAFDRWLADPDGKLAVAVDEDDRAVALGRGVLLSPTEAWFQGARVHPDWRRRGLASRIDNRLEEWARRRGARVARLAIEEWNEPAIAQVRHIGMRSTGTWLHAHRPLELPAQRTGPNGEHRHDLPPRLVPAPSAEAEPALMSWASSELGRLARGLLTVGWTWRILTPEDLVAAARADALFMSSTGWCLAAIDEAQLEVGWMDTSPDDASDMLWALLDLAKERGAAAVDIKVPAASWMVAAAHRHRYETSQVIIFAKAL